MQLRTKLLAAAFVGLTMIGSTSNSYAASMTYTLDLTVDNTWKVLASSAAEPDNFGIALYSWRFAGQTITSDNAAPRTTAPSSGSGNPAGFTFLRTADNTNAAVENNLVVSGSQDTTLVPNDHLIYGYSQENSGFVAKGVTPGGAIEQPVWTSPLLLAQGTYNRLLNPGLTLDMASLQTFVNVFSAADDPQDEANPTVKRVENLSLVRLPFIDNTAPNINDVVLPGPYNANEPGEPQTMQQQMTADDAQQPLCAGCTWDNLQLLSYTPNYGGEGPVPGFNNNPNTNPNLSATGLFTWVTEGAPRGDYVWAMRTTDAGGLSDTGTLSMAITHVPEPASLALFGLALAGIFGFARRGR